MSKILKISLSIILIVYLIFLWKYLLIEEIIGLYLVPILVVAVIAGLCFLLIRIFKPIKYKKVFTGFLVVACILQVGILFLFFYFFSSQSYTKEQITGDIDFAINMMEDVHPDPYSIISKEDFYRKMDSIKKELPETVPDLVAHKTFRKIYALIKDGHTSHPPFPKNPFYNFLPYRFKIVDERIYLAHNYSYRNVIPVGSEIISINEKSSQEYIQEASQLFSWENIPSRNTKLQFPILSPLWDDSQNFKITYKTPEGKTKTTHASGGIFSLLQFSKDMKQFDSQYNYEYRYLSDSIGYIEFNWFFDLDKFKVFLDSTFTAIQNKNIKYLIIDIRKNGGGDSSLGDELMQYISKVDFKDCDSTYIKISKELIEKYMFEWIDSTKRKPGTIYKITNEPLTKLKDNPLRFTGKTYLLVGEKTFSSASMFTSAFQCFKVGTIIGTETGGLTVCFGNLYSYTLPETKFDMNLSYKKFYQVCGKEDRHGIIPDYIIENSIEDDVNSYDRVLEFTLDLIKKDKLSVSE